MKYEHKWLKKQQQYVSRYSIIQYSCIQIIKCRKDIKEDIKVSYWNKKYFQKNIFIYVYNNNC